METEPPTTAIEIAAEKTNPEATDVINQQQVSIQKRLSNEYEENDANNTIHGFNMSNVTVIEKPISEPKSLEIVINGKPTSCEGSDSGVEVTDTCTLQRASSINSTNSQEFGTVTPACSYESSIISCCSNYEEAYNLLARRNSTLLEDYKLRTCDGTSEGGSESSSVAGSLSSRTSKRVTLAKKKSLASSGSDSKNKSLNPTQRSRSRPPVTPKNSTPHPRGKSTDKSQQKSPHSKQTENPKTPRKTVPASLPLSNSTSKKESKTKAPATAASRGSSTTRTPITTPTDDGRWPSIHSRPAPLMGRSMRGLFTGEAGTRRATPLAETKTIEKYATLPRRRKEKSADSLPEQTIKTSTIKRQPSTRESSVTKTLPPYPRKNKKPKTKIYHEMSIQTALTQADIEKALSGIVFNLANPQDVEKCVKEVQVERSIEEVEKLQEELRTLTENHEKLLTDYKKQTETMCDVEQRLKEEKLEKEGLQQELKQNTERVLAILGNDSDLPDDENTSDSLMVLENRYQKVGQIMIKQENEISELNSCCRSLQKDLEKSLATQKSLLQQQHDLETEGRELQEFMQAEKSTLADALKEAETDVKRLTLVLTHRDKEIENKQDESKRLVRLGEQKRQENVSLQARLSVMEARSRELLIYQGGHISGASVALASLISRLEGLVDELVSSYSISDQELDDVIFHNEAYTNSGSSPDATPEKCNKKFLKEKSPSPKRGSSFVSAIINAIRNATAQTPFSNSKEISKDTISLDNSDSAEMLDSETEPCLMMEPVLEDVVIPDGHSHNMISSGHGMLSSARLTHSESLNNISQAILHRQLSEQASLSVTESLNASFTSEMSSLNEFCPSVPLVDQVIEVDNLVTRLLKVLRIIQIENDDCMNELQDDRDHLSEQVEKQKEANKVVVKQLKDWETLGAHLKSEVTELMQQLTRKNNEIDDLKSELNHHRKEIERLTEDVCALSTTCSKAELELKTKQEQINDAIKKWDESNEEPTKEVLAKLFAVQKEVPILKEKLTEKEKQLNELRQEFLDSRQVLSENWKEAVAETKKQYEAIDSALEILHSIQTVVQQCPPLAKLQRDLEETSFQTASSMPIATPSDCNANGALMKPVNSLEIPSPINSTA